jgi:excisionase family DNA binding protein
LVNLKGFTVNNIQNYRPKEAAKYLGVGLSTVWLYIKQGKLQSIKLSERVTIVSQESLDSFINASVEVA